MITARDVTDEGAIGVTPGNHRSIRADAWGAAIHGQRGDEVALGDIHAAHMERDVDRSGFATGAIHLFVA